jgi:hypothetical protein
VAKRILSNALYSLGLCLIMFGPILAISYGKGLFWDALYFSSLWTVLIVTGTCIGLEVTE